MFHKNGERGDFQGAICVTPTFKFSFYPKIFTFQSFIYKLSFNSKPSLYVCERKRKGLVLNEVCNQTNTIQSTFLSKYPYILTSNAH